MKRMAYSLAFIVAFSLTPADAQKARECKCLAGDAGCQMVKCSGIGSTKGGGSSNKAAPRRPKDLSRM